MTHNLQITSDIHLEFYSDDITFEAILKPTSDNLALLGDIGYPTRKNYKTFIAYCSENFLQVFLITGNHEYYCTKDNDLSMVQVDGLIKNIVKEFDNVHFLNNDFYELDNLLILGSTLWSYIESDKYSLVKYYINDYNYIYNDNELVTPKDTSSMHDVNITWLKNILEKNKNKEVIILTHHLPSYKAIHHKYKSFSGNCAFASNLDDIMINNKNIKYWFYGHTHTTTEFTLYSTLCASNPMGYKYDASHENISYDNEKVYKL